MSHHRQSRLELLLESLALMGAAALLLSAFAHRIQHPTPCIAPPNGLQSGP